MRLLVFSDLHLEHAPDWRIPDDLPDYDVLVAAGDIDAPPRRAIERLAAHPLIGRRPCVYVAGNHEFYRGVIGRDEADGQRAAAGTMVHYLDRGSVTIDGVRFCGGTLWTDYALDGSPHDSMAAARQRMNDPRLIERLLPDGTRAPFWPEDACERHIGKRDAIDAVLAQPFEGPSVVVTHYAPAPQSIAPRYAGEPLNAAFASDLTALIRRRQPDLWIHGHTHASADYRIGRTRVVANPKGYGPHRGGTPATIENPQFDPHLVVTVG